MPVKVVFITPIAPFPVTGGERIRSLGLLGCLDGLGYEVQAVTPEITDMAGLDPVLPRTRFHFYDFSQEDRAPISQFAGYFRKDAALAGLLGAIIRDFQPDLAFFDYFYLGQYIDLFTRQGIPVIYGTHNAQARLRLDQPAGSLNEKVVRRFAYLAQSAHERRYFNRANALVVVSEHDKDYHAQFVEHGKIVLIPNFLDERSYCPSKEKEEYIVMTGNFESFQNRYGIEWFVSEIWNEELKGKVRLVLAGKGSEELAGKHGWTLAGDNIQAMGYARDIGTVIGKARVAVVPLLHGGGTRFKILEAMALGTQVVSTAKGAEGIEHHGSVLIADEPSRFREALLGVLHGEMDNTQPAREIFLEKYSMQCAKNTIHELVSELLAK